IVRRAEPARVFGAVERLQRGAGFENAAAAGTEHVPRHVEEADPGGVHQRADHWLFAKFVLGGEGERIDAAERAVRSGFYRRLQRIGDGRVGSLLQKFPERLRFSHRAASVTAQDPDPGRMIGARGSRVKTDRNTPGLAWRPL